jgi:hypothetical protein
MNGINTKMVDLKFITHLMKVKNEKYNIILKGSKCLVLSLVFETLYNSL